MAEHDEGGDRLRREFLRQAPEFDLQPSLREKVSALVRRRQRMRRSWSSVVSLWSSPPWPFPSPRCVRRPSVTGSHRRRHPHPHPPRRLRPPPHRPPRRPRPKPSHHSRVTASICGRPCSGTFITTTATLGDVTATLTGTTNTPPGGDPVLSAPELTVAMGDRHFSEMVAPPAQTDAVIPWSMGPVPSTPSPPNSDALCLARFPGQDEATLVLGLDTGGAHCCTVVRPLRC